MPTKNQRFLNHENRDSRTQTTPNPAPDQVPDVAPADLDPAAMCDSPPEADGHPNQIPHTVPDVAVVDVLDVIEDEFVLHVPSLTFRQQAALPIIAVFPSISQAAQASGIGETTLRRWFNDPNFSREVARARQESANLARQELQGLMLRSVSVIADALDDPNPAIRLRAARYAMSLGNRFSEVQQLAEDLKELKTYLESN